MTGWIYARRSSWAGRWLPLLLAMGVIFFVSNQPSTDLPSFGLWDLAVKKTGHFVAYAGLALLALRAVWGGKRPYLTATIIVLFYALTDEFHQTFVPGRNGTLVDVAIDMSGALTCLWLVHWRQWTPQHESHASVETF